MFKKLFKKEKNLSNADEYLKESKKALQKLGIDVKQTEPAGDCDNQYEVELRPLAIKQKQKETSHDQKKDVLLIPFNKSPEEALKVVKNFLKDC